MHVVVFPPHAAGNVISQKHLTEQKYKCIYKLTPQIHHCQGASTGWSTGTPMTGMPRWRSCGTFLPRSTVQAVQHYRGQTTGAAWLGSGPDPRTWVFRVVHEMFVVLVMCELKLRRSVFMIRLRVRPCLSCDLSISAMSVFLQCLVLGTN